MKVSSFNQEVKLLDIARQGRINPKVNVKAEGTSFKDAFTQELASSKGVNFSKHARQRLFSRGINLSDSKLEQISNAIDKAELKGSKDTLILDDVAAYVASVPNRTIITAFDRATLQDGVFTSIDSAVIIKDE